MNRRYTDIKVYGDVYVSSSLHYFAHVRYTCDEKVHRRDICLNDSSIEYRDHLGYLKIPAYFQKELEAGIIALLKDPTTRFYEYDQDKNKRFEDLRYYDPEYVKILLNRPKGES